MKRLLAAAILTVAVVGTVAGCGGKDIGRDAALEAALNDAGVSESDTTRLQVSEDRDDGQKVYEIRFDVDNTGYEYEVAAADGSILSSDIENQDDGTQAQGNVQNGTQDDDQGTAQNNGENAQNNTSQGTGTANSANVAVTQDRQSKRRFPEYPGLRSRISGSVWIMMTEFTNMKETLSTTVWNTILKSTRIPERFWNGARKRLISKK